MKYLSLVTIRAFVVLGLSLGCAKAQMSKEEVMLFFKDIDVEETGCTKKIGVGIRNDKMTVQWESVWSGKKKGRKIVFLENSFLFTSGKNKILFSYRHLKRLEYGINMADRPQIWIEM